MKAALIIAAIILVLFVLRLIAAGTTAGSHQPRKKGQYVHWNRDAWEDGTIPPSKNLGSLIHKDRHGNWHWDEENISAEIDPNIRWGDHEE